MGSNVLKMHWISVEFLRMRECDQWTSSWLLTSYSPSHHSIRDRLMTLLGPFVSVAVQKLKRSLLAMGLSGLTHCVFLRYRDCKISFKMDRLDQSEPSAATGRRCSMTRRLICRQSSCNAKTVS